MKFGNRRHHKRGAALISGRKFLIGDVSSEDDSICDTKFCGELGKVIPLSPVTNKFDDHVWMLGELCYCLKQDVNSLLVIQSP